VLWVNILREHVASLGVWQSCRLMTAMLVGMVRLQLLLGVVANSPISRVVVVEWGILRSAWLAILVSLIVLALDRRGHS
jgi:hypothetical protein